MSFTKEFDGCFRFFYDNFSRSECAYGLMPDKHPDTKGICSIAANGFMLAAMAVGVDFDKISLSEGARICEKTIDTLLQLPHDNGFLYHFYTIPQGKRANNCELSIIDTALAVAGALTAGGYFGGSVMDKARKLYNRLNWQYFYDDTRKLFHMAKYDSGFSCHWDMFAEQLIVYVLAAGSGWQNAKEAYYSFRREYADYHGEKYVYTWFGSLFVHQFSHAFADFRNKIDQNGTDWFHNSVLASMANHDYCATDVDHKGYSNLSWGLTSCATQQGYTGHIGVPPSGNGNTEHITEGTVAPAGAIGSIVFTPMQSIDSLNYYYTLPQLVGDYGLYDSYNANDNWYCNHYISIDKGISLLMMANYQKQTVWKTFDNITEIHQAFQNLGFISTKGE